LNLKHGMKNGNKNRMKRKHRARRKLEKIIPHWCPNVAFPVRLIL